MNLQKVSSLVRLVSEMTRPFIDQVPVASHVIKGVGSRPVSCRMGMLKLSVVTVSSLYVGGMVAQKGASYLEENEIFVPSDEDEED